MSKRSMHQLKEMMCRELDEIAGKGELSAGDLEAVHTLTDTYKNILKIDMLDEGEEYSRAGGWNARGTYGRDGGYDRDYDSGDSYGRHYVRGHYSRAKDMFEDKLREKMENDELTPQEWKAIQKALETI